MEKGFGGARFPWPGRQVSGFRVLVFSGVPGRAGPGSRLLRVIMLVIVIGCVQPDSKYAGLETHATSLPITQSPSVFLCVLCGGCPWPGRPWTGRPWSGRQVSGPECRAFSTNLFGGSSAPPWLCHGLSTWAPSGPWGPEPGSLTHNPQSQIINLHSSIIQSPNSSALSVSSVVNHPPTPQSPISIHQSPISIHQSSISNLKSSINQSPNKLLTWQKRFNGRRVRG